MQYRLLGRSALNISRIGFGCMSLKPGQQDIPWLINEAVDKGINYFDTADLYDKGLNEIALGKALKGTREKVIIATKGGNEWNPDGNGWNWNASKAHIIKAAEQSLQRLQTGYIDLYQLHGGTIDDPIDETIEAFELLKQQGKIRYYGISSIRPNVIREYIKRSNIISVMMQYSLLDRRPEENCLSLLQENNIGVLARGSIAGGLLGGKTAKPYLNYTEEEVAMAAEAVKKIASQNDSADVAIRFTLEHPAITAAIVGIRTGNQLTEAVDAINKVPLGSEALSQLISAIPINYYEQHR
jgi:aryl-alcohol dehydrogenase-like predicted oxidoreductase